MIWAIGTVAMILDHVGAILYPDVLALRIVGRCAYPLFSLGIANGMEWTKDRQAYLSRLALLVPPAEVVHWWAFGAWGSPVSMLFAGACMLQLQERVQMLAVYLGVLLGPWVGPWVLPVAWAHGGWPVALVMISHAGGNWVQWCALAAIPLAWMGAGERAARGGVKWLKYSLYPAHLGAIKALAFLT